jgi:hypothetical protein
LLGVELFQALLTEVALRRQDFIEFCRVVRLVQDFSGAAGLRSVLERLAGQFLSRSSHAVVFPKARVVGRGRHVDHRKCL